MNHKFRQHGQDFGKASVYSGVMPLDVNSLPIFKFTAKASAGLNNGLEVVDVEAGTEYTMRFKDVGCFSNLVSLGVIEPITRIQ